MENNFLADMKTQHLMTQHQQKLDETITDVFDGVGKSLNKLVKNSVKSSKNIDKLSNDTKMLSSINDTLKSIYSLSEDTAKKNESSDDSDDSDGVGDVLGILESDKKKKKKKKDTTSDISKLVYNRLGDEDDQDDGDGEDIMESIKGGLGKLKPKKKKNKFKRDNQVKKLKLNLNKKGGFFGSMISSMGASIVAVGLLGLTMKQQSEDACGVTGGDNQFGPKQGAYGTASNPMSRNKKGKVITPSIPNANVVSNPIPMVDTKTKDGKVLLKNALEVAPQPPKMTGADILPSVYNTKLAKSNWATNNATSKPQDTLLGIKHFDIFGQNELKYATLPVDKEANDFTNLSGYNGTVEWRKNLPMKYRKSIKLNSYTKPDLTGMDKTFMKQFLGMAQEFNIMSNGGKILVNKGVKPGGHKTGLALDHNVVDNKGKAFNNEKGYIPESLLIRYGFHRPLMHWGSVYNAVSKSSDAEDEPWHIEPYPGENKYGSPRNTLAYTSWDDSLEDMKYNQPYRMGIVQNESKKHLAYNPPDVELKSKGGGLNVNLPQGNVDAPKSPDTGTTYRTLSPKTIQLIAKSIGDKILKTV